MENYTEESLERFLVNGHTLGFTNDSENPGWLGWVILRKEKVDNRYLSLLEKGEEIWFRKKQEIIAEKPYVVQIIELERSKHEDENFQEEYDRNDIYRFSDLAEVQVFLNKHDKKLKDIKWLTEIDFS